MLVSDIVNGARVELHDAEAPYRYTDQQMLDWAEAAQTELIGRRPDALSITGIVTTKPDAISALTDSISVRDEFRAALVYYICHRCLQTDQEHAANAQTATNYLTQFVGLLQ